jgi:hypothetical protein
LDFFLFRTISRIENGIGFAWGGFNCVTPTGCSHARTKLEKPAGKITEECRESMVIRKVVWKTEMIDLSSQNPQCSNYLSNKFKVYLASDKFHLYWPDHCCHHFPVVEQVCRQWVST